MAKKEGSTKKKWWWKGIGSVVTAVIAGLILEELADVPVFSTLGRLIKAIGKAFTDPVSLPLWLVILLPVVGAGAVIGWKALVRWRRPTSTRIDGIDWEWEWEGEEPYNLVALCPECKTELDRLSQKERKGNWTAVRCGHCHFLTSIDGVWGEVVERVKKEIRRGQRAGKYKVKKRLESKSEDV